MAYAGRVLMSVYGVHYQGEGGAACGLLWFESRTEAVRLMEQMMQVRQRYRAVLVVQGPEGELVEAP